FDAESQRHRQRGVQEPPTEIAAGNWCRAVVRRSERLRSPRGDNEAGKTMTSGFVNPGVAGLPAENGMAAQILAVGGRSVSGARLSPVLRASAAVINDSCSRNNPIG